MSEIDFESLNRAALSACPLLLEKLLPGGKAHGREYECGNLDGEAGDSLKVNADRDFIASNCLVEGLEQDRFFYPAGKRF